MRGVCVLGGSKTGTTGLYSAVHAGLRAREPRCYGLLEKHDPHVLANLQRLAPHTAVVAKFLLTNQSFDPALAAPFDTRLLIVRDPRDTLLSAALYYPVRALNKGVDQRAIDDYVALVREKERDPASHSFLELLVAVYRLMGGQVGQRTRFGRRFRLVTDVVDHLDALVVRYEDFIRDDLAEASDHLGFEVRNTRPSDYSSLVLRSGGAGEWRHWFTPADVEHFRPVMAEYLDRFGYGDDWELAPEPRIDPEHGSRYVERAVQARRRQIELNDAGGPDSEELLGQLRQRADEGSPRAAVKLARALQDDDPRAHADEVRERLWFAAACGDVGAMRRLAVVLAEGDPHDREEAARWMAEADAEDERRSLRAWAAEDGTGRVDVQRELVDHRRALQQLRASKRWRVASLLADAPRRGPAALARAPVRAWRILRS